MDPSTPVPIHALSTDGRGIGRLPNGQIVFVAGALPGEVVTIDVVQAKKHFSEARLQTLIQSSAHRVPAPCPIYGPCGGCQIQHMAAPNQPPTKAAWFLETLSRVGKWPGDALEWSRTHLQVEVLPPFGYRQRVTAVVLEGGQLGFQEPQSQNTVVAAQCLLAHPLIQKVWEAVAKALSPRVCSKIVFTAVVAKQAVHIDLFQGKRPLPQRRVKEILAHIPGIWWFQDFPLPLSFAPHFTQPSSSFVQPHWRAPDCYGLATSQAVSQALQTLALPNPQDPLVVWDLYGGSGLFAAALAHGLSPRPFVGTTVEAHSLASSYAARNAPSFTVQNASVDTFLSTSPPRAHVVVVDPPRGGCGPRVMGQLLARLHPQSCVVFWGCDGATFARDTRHLMERGYSLELLHLWDAFGQTRHYEVMGLWVRRAEHLPP